MATTTNAITPPGRLSFPALSAPESYQGGAAVYTATVVWDRDALDGDPAWADLMELVDDEARRAFRVSLPELRDANIRCPLRKGIEKPKLEHYRGTVFAKASTKFPARVIGPDEEEVDPADPREVYPGRWCRMRVSPWSWSTGGRGVGLRLIAVQLLIADDGPGEPFAEGGGGEPFGDLPAGFSRTADRHEDRHEDRHGGPEDGYPPPEGDYPAAAATEDQGDPDSW